MAALLETAIMVGYYMEAAIPLNSGPPSSVAAERSFFAFSFSRQ
jgi:hypothetical protein